MGGPRAVGADGRGVRHAVLRRRRRNRTQVRWRLPQVSSLAHPHPSLSITATRLHYLNLTVFSVGAVFRDIVVVVSNKQDYAYLEASGLPLFQILPVYGLANPKTLGVASVIAVQQQ